MSKPIYPLDNLWCIDPSYVGRLRNGQGVADDREAGYVPAEVSVVEVCGPIEKYATQWGERVGAVSAVELATEIDAAAADPDADGIVLRIDSPGGQVSAIEPIVQAIHEARKTTLVVAHATGLAAGTALAVACECHIVLADRDTQVGALGVQALLCLFGDPGPENDAIVDGLADLMQELGSLVLDRVRQVMNVDSNTLRRASFGHTYIAEHAEAAGLISRIRDLDAAVEMAQAGLVPAERIMK